MLQLSRHGTRVIKRFPDHLPVHGEGNEYRDLLDHGIGKWWDNTEDLIYKLVEKRKLTTNVSDESDPESEDYKIGKELLDKIGLEFDLVRLPWENNTDFRARILANKNKDISVASIKQMISALLGVSPDKVTITQPNGLCVNDNTDSELEVLGMQYTTGYFLISIDEDYFDTYLIMESIKKNILNGVRFNIKNKEGVVV